MKISIKSRFDGSVLFEGEYESLKHALIDAVAKKTNLYGARLDGASVAGVKLNGELLKICPLQMQLIRWPVMITPGYMVIGCERHTHAEWEAFDRLAISKMDSGAWDWWQEHKPLLFMACEFHRKQAMQEPHDAY